jgi:hypothetical protein
MALWPPRASADRHDLHVEGSRSAVALMQFARRPGNRAARKALDRAHIAKTPRKRKPLKLADLIDNSRSILAHDPGFTRVYMREKALLLDVREWTRNCGDWRLGSSRRRLRDCHEAWARWY